MSNIACHITEIQIVACRGTHCPENNEYFGLASQVFHNKIIYELILKSICLWEAV